MASRCDHFWCKIVWCSAGCESPQIWAITGAMNLWFENYRGFLNLGQNYWKHHHWDPLGPFYFQLCQLRFHQAQVKEKENRGIWFLVCKKWFLPTPSCPCAKTAAATSLAHCHLCQAHVSEFDVAEPDMDSEKLCCQVKQAKENTLWKWIVVDEQFGNSAKSKAQFWYMMW